jgi:ribosomal-protein-alanine N-acetyltransferase
VTDAIEIVPMLPDDLDAVDEIERHSFKSPWPAQVFAEELTREWARVDVARERGRVVGFVDYWLVQDEIHLLAIATHPDARRRGIARLLLDHLLALGRARDSALVTLEVRRNNVPAIALYERAGFATVGVRPRYYAEDNQDALVMTLTFRPQSI